MGTGGDWLDTEVAHRRIAEGENRLPPALAVIVAVLAYALLPDTVLFAPRLVIPAVEVALLIALLVTNPRRLVRQTRWSRIVSVVLVGVVITTNLVTLGLLIHSLVSAQTKGTTLLVAAMQVWLTNVIGFGLLFWELDRGGPVTRREARRDKLPAADWRFSQDENEDTIAEVAVDLERRIGLDPDLPRLPLPVGDEFQRVQPDRHDAPDQPREDLDGDRGNRSVAHLAADHRPGRRLARYRWLAGGTLREGKPLPGVGVP